jgi:hypothetical protein
MWVREPEFRVEVDLDGQPLGPWVSDGETTNILEPHVHAFAFTATDPRGPDLFFCDHMILAGPARWRVGPQRRSRAAPTPGP